MNAFEHGLNLQIFTLLADRAQRFLERRNERQRGELPREQRQRLAIEPPPRQRLERQQRRCTRRAGRRFLKTDHIEFFCTQTAARIFQRFGDNLPAPLAPGGVDDEIIEVSHGPPQPSSDPRRDIRTASSGVVSPSITSCRAAAPKLGSRA